MLADPDTQVASVAAAVGYDSEAAFSRAFKRIAGTSPPIGGGAGLEARRHTEPRLYVPEDQPLTD